MGSVEIASISDVGGRSANEDKVLTVRLNDIQVLAVADGMGGHAAGEVASNIALIEIEKFMESNIGKGDILDVVKQAIAKANREVYLLSSENDEYAGMGTTLVMTLVENATAITANVGDSRAYHISSNRIRQITKDHSAVQDLLDKGRISEEEARDHASRHIITRVLGTGPEVTPDIFNTALNRGDTLLLCSDGLTGALLDEEIFNIINYSGDLNEACSELVIQAKANDAHDNISVILVRRKREITK